MTPEFLTSLGLGAEASERDVRRAYAQRLKAIDHEVEVDAFHALRDDYQSALQWVTERGQQPAGQDPVLPRAEDASSVPPRVVPARAPGEAGAGGDGATATATATVTAAQTASEDDDGLAVEPVDPEQQVFDEFNTKVRHWIASEANAQTALDAALRDPRLSSIDAPARFEIRVAVLLAKGWRPGHQFLFPPAINTFGWTQDFRRLETLGPLGEFLKAAIWQRQAFFEQRAEVFDRYATLIRRVREGREPTEHELLEGMPRLSRLMAQTPEWLQVVTSMPHVRRWQECFDTLPEPMRLEAMKRALPVGEQRPPWWKRISPSTFIWLFLLLVGIGKQVISELNR